MTKQTFLFQLSWRLRVAGVPDYKSYVRDYEELIDERVANGEDEAEVLLHLWTPKQVVDDILEEEGIERRRWLTGGQLALLIILAILGFPIWGGILLAAFGILFGVIVAFASLYLSLWAFPFTFAIFTLVGFGIGAFGLPASVMALLNTNWIYGLSEIGVAFLSLGISLICATILVLSTKLLIIIARAIFHLFDRMLGRKSDLPIVMPGTFTGFWTSKWFWLVVLVLLVIGGAIFFTAWGANGWNLPTAPHVWYNWFNQHPYINL